MSKGIIKTIVFGIVFVAAVIIFSFATNHTNEDLTTEMKEASFPVVSLYYEKEQVNELFGYKDEMNALYMRDSITPIGTDRILPVRIQTYGYRVDGLSYEIRSMDTSRLIVDQKVEDYTNEKNTVTADLTIENLLEEGQEYLMILKLTSGKETIRYYTRIIEPSDCYVKESIDFAKNFHDTSLNKDTAGTLATYVEPNASGDNSTLNKVDIHSTLNQISWADFKGEQLTQPTVSVKEINTSYNVILLDYIMTSAGDGEELEYYNVEEYYRVRYTNDRLYLLNYERNMSQIFRGENSNFYDNHIQLGIRDGEIQYKENENGNIVCFVQEGELWSYNANESRLSKVFSFRGYEGMDDRENNDAHDIRIIKTDEAGSVDFVVYGYMNRGDHEGEVGICVYHYDSVANTVEEELFIPSDKSYEVMKAELGRLMYENESGCFYIMMNGSVYQIDMKTLECKELVNGLTENGYAVSESHRYVAYTKGEANQASAVSVLDLETGDTFEVSADAGNYIRPLGFMEDDFIYGEAKTDMVTVDTAGNTVYPMHCVRILATGEADHPQLKSYEKDGYYISGIEIKDYTIYLNRMQYNGVAYVDADQDTIMNREADTDELVTVASTVTEEKQTQYQLVLTSEEELTAKKLQTPEQIILEQSKDIAIEEGEHAPYYYAYARGRVLCVTENVSDAIDSANDNMGVVLDDSQKYIWKRAKKTLQSALTVTVGDADAGSGTIAKCMNAMLGREELNVGVQTLLDRGDTPQTVLTDTMQGKTVLDLTGCNLEEVLYYVNKGTPVFAMTSGTDAVLIIGYDVNSVTVFDPAAGSNKRMTLEEATDLFKQSGNVFLAYLRD